MVQLNRPYDQNNVTDNDFPTLPPAAYTLAITKTKESPTSATKNLPESQQVIKYELEMDVQGGEFQGRKVFELLNLNSSNDQARNIAERTLKKICEACGIVMGKELDVLVGIPFIGHVEVKEGEPKDKNNPQGERWSAKNIVKKYEAMPSHGAPTQAVEWPGAK